VYAKSEAPPEIVSLAKTANSTASFASPMPNSSVVKKKGTEQ
jgi:hypothetical protein